MNVNEDDRHSYTLIRTNRTSSVRRITANETSIQFLIKPKLSIWRILINKLVKNGLLIVSFLALVFIYYLYMFWFIIPFFYKSQAGLNIKFWLYMDDLQYRKCTI